MPEEVLGGVRGSSQGARAVKYFSPRHSWAVPLAPGRHFGFSRRWRAAAGERDPWEKAPRSLNRAAAETFLRADLLSGPRSQRVPVPGGREPLS